MKRHLISLLCMFCIMAASAPAFAQQDGGSRTAVSGKVTDSDGLSVIGAVVMASSGEAATTDENGNYTIDKKFLIGPHYAIVFENNKDFDIWGQYGPLAKANHNMGWHRKTGHSEDIYTNSDAWKWAAVNNAAYEYYQMIYYA